MCRKFSFGFTSELRSNGLGISAETDKDSPENR